MSPRRPGGDWMARRPQLVCHKRSRNRLGGHARGLPESERPLSESTSAQSPLALTGGERGLGTDSESWQTAPAMHEQAPPHPKCAAAACARLGLGGYPSRPAARLRPQPAPRRAPSTRPAFQASTALLTRSP